MDVGLGFLGPYISAAELVGKTPTLTISKVTLEQVEDLSKADLARADGDSGGRMRDRVVVYFREAKGGRGWLLNRTNAEAIKELWGRETENWLGHKITLHVVDVRVGLKIEPGIRVKGSPELTAPRTFMLALPRKKPVKTVLQPTGKPGATQASPETQSPASGPPGEPEDQFLRDLDAAAEQRAAA